MGKYPDGATYWFSMTDSRDSSNLAPDDHIVFSEIMYHPLIDSSNDEYVELYNPTGSTVQLYNTDGQWRLDNAVSFTFPPTLSMDAGDRIVIVPFDPAVETERLITFEVVYGCDLTANVNVFGPYSGNLSNASERLALEMPQAPGPLEVDYSWIIIDQVTYSDYYPWPDTPDGAGDALVRISSSGIYSGDDPNNWDADTPWPGKIAPLPPEKATNPVPTNGAEGQSRNVILTWSNGGGATDYDVYFGTDSTPDSGEFKVNTTSTNHNPGILLPTTTYYWRIDANSPAGTTTGDVWNFTTSEWAMLTYDDFEADWGSYTDGGSDCSRYTGGTYAHEGNCAADIQDNSGDASAFWHTDAIDVDSPGYTQIEVGFWFYADSMDENEYFSVKFFDGSAWQTVASYVLGTDFDNGNFYPVTLYIDEGVYNFPSDMRLKFECVASGNSDDVYIDEIAVSAK